MEAELRIRSSKPSVRILIRFFQELSHFMTIYSSGWETIGQACTVVKIARVDEKQIDIFLLRSTSGTG